MSSAMAILVGEMTTLSRVALGALYAAFGVVLYSTLGTFRRQNRRLSDAEAQYRNLVEQVPVVVYMDAVDDISSALYVSPRYEQLVGYTPAERLADPELWSRLLHPSDREWVLAHLPDAELRRQRAAYRRGVLWTGSISFAILAVVLVLSFYAEVQRRLAVARNAQSWASLWLRRGAISRRGPSFA